MKKTILTLIILLSIITLGFNQNTFSIGDKWNNLIYKVPSFTIDNESIIVGQDTTIGELNYKTLSRFVNGRSDKIKTLGFIRETIDKKIFFRPDSALVDYLIYDFSINVNDTVSVYSINSFNNQTYFSQFDLYVEKIDSIIINGMTHKQFHLFPLSHEGFVTDIWIENIGNKDGFIHINAGLVGGDSYKLICYSNNDGLYYQNPDFLDCDYKTSINSLQGNKQLKIFPNPLTNEAIIQINEFDYSQKYRLQIFNNNGQLIHDNEISCEYTLNRHDFDSGIYIVKITNEKTILGMKKILIK